MPYRFNPLPPRFDRIEGGSSSPDIETITGNSGGAVGPDAAFNINLIGSNGITIVGTPGSNTLTASLQNSEIGTGQTIGATTDDVITVALSTAGTYTFEVRVAAWESSGPYSAGYSKNAVIRSDGVTATLIGDSDGFGHTDTALDDADVNIIASGNNAIIRVLGVAGLTINWGVFSVYVFRGA
jgi:hypothetical protein